MEIVAADAMQVYIGLDVGTAKPTAAEQARVAHHLIDVVVPSEPFSVAAYVKAAEAAILDAAARGVACLVVGGTGFYLDALANGLPATPPADPEVQASLWARAEREGVLALHEALRAVAPIDAARADRNPRRIVRALEVLERTGRPPSAFGRSEPRVDLDRTWLIPPMDALEPRIVTRTRAMFDGGLVEEATRLDERSLATASQAIGYREAALVARGALSREAAIDAVVLATRKYARRQRTWFARHAAERIFPRLGHEVHGDLAAWLEQRLPGSA